MYTLVYVRLLLIGLVGGIVGLIAAIRQDSPDLLFASILASGASFMIAIEIVALGWYYVIWWPAARWMASIGRRLDAIEQRVDSLAEDMGISLDRDSVPDLSLRQKITLTAIRLTWSNFVPGGLAIAVASLTWTLLAAGIDNLPQSIVLDVQYGVALTAVGLLPGFSWVILTEYKVRKLRTMLSRVLLASVRCEYEQFPISTHGTWLLPGAFLTGSKWG